MDLDNTSHLVPVRQAAAQLDKEEEGTEKASEDTKMELDESALTGAKAEVDRATAGPKAGTPRRPKGGLK